MSKLLLQLGVALGIWIAAKSAGLHYALSVVFVLSGFVAVHLLYERYIFNPYLYLGVMHVDPDDPLMVDAEAKTSETLRLFLDTLYEQYPKDSVVKFSYNNASDTVEKLWGDLLSVSGNELTVFVRTPPVEPTTDFEREMKIDASRIVDWSVELEDGALLGGFTNRALFKIFEREEGYMHPKFKEHLARFRDVEVEA